MSTSVEGRTGSLKKKKENLMNSYSTLHTCFKLQLFLEGSLAHLFLLSGDYNATCFVKTHLTHYCNFMYTFLYISSSPQRLVSDLVPSSRQPDSEIILSNYLWIKPDHRNTQCESGIRLLVSQDLRAWCPLDIKAVKRFFFFGFGVVSNGCIHKSIIKTYIGLRDLHEIMSFQIWMKYLDFHKFASNHLEF